MLIEFHKALLKCCFWGVISNQSHCFAFNETIFHAGWIVYIVEARGLYGICWQHLWLCWSNSSPPEYYSLYNLLNLTDLHSLNPDSFFCLARWHLARAMFSLLWHCPLKFAIVGTEHGGYISLNVIVSVDFHQIGPLNVTWNVDCDCNIPLEFCIIWLSISL